MEQEWKGEALESRARLEERGDRMKYEEVGGG